MPAGRSAVAAERTNVSGLASNSGTGAAGVASSRMPLSKNVGPQSSAPSLLDEFERELLALITRLDMIAAAICDRDGAFLCKVFNDSKADGIFQKSMLNQKLFNSGENLAKLDMGAMGKVLLEYDRYQIMKFFNSKFIVTFIAGPQVPSGTLFALEPDCRVIFQTLRDHFD